MKLFFKIMTLCTLLMGALACNKQEEEVELPLEVNYVHLHGTWKLAEMDGSETPEGVYCYLVLDREEHTFKMYDNLSSMYARLNTGHFELVNDVHKGDKISGKYDYSRGEWKDEFMITELMPSGSMIWTGVAHPDHVQKFIRCESVPEEIVKEARQEGKE